MDRSPCPHLKLLHVFQPVQIRHQSDPVFQRPQELHLELHHLTEVPEQNVQLQHNTQRIALIRLLVWKPPTSIFSHLLIYSRLNLSHSDPSVSCSTASYLNINGY